MPRHRLLYLIVLVLFVLFSGSVSGSGQVDETLEREILETFAEYQDEAISGSKHLGRSYARNWCTE